METTQKHLNNGHTTIVRNVDLRPDFIIGLLSLRNHALLKHAKLVLAAGACFMAGPRQATAEDRLALKCNTLYKAARCASRQKNVKCAMGISEDGEVKNVSHFFTNSKSTQVLPRSKHIPSRL